MDIFLDPHVFSRVSPTLWPSSQCTNNCPKKGYALPEKGKYLYLYIYMEVSINGGIHEWMVHKGRYYESG